jgi:hypothetical protein
MPLREFEYSPLHAGRNEFRLLSLRPGTQDHIQCLLRTHSLDQAPPYEALSYSWGSKAELKPISLNSSVVQICTNLYSALRHLRHRDSDRILWIDAICINQNDNTEKNDQVRLMRRIYTAAEQVVVWLGEAIDATGLTLSKIEEMAELESENIPSMTLKWLREELFGAEAWNGLLDLFGRAWWTRTWVVQEVTVAKQVVICCGNKEMLAGCFDKAMSNLDFIKLFSKRREGLLSLEDDALGRRIRHLNGTTHDLLDLADKCRELEATDPRDKIYALLGLAEDDQFEVDYDQSVREVYRRFAEACIERSGTLDVFNFVIGSYRNDIPSWVPDWTFGRIPSLIGHTSRKKDQTYSASGDSTADFHTLFSLAKGGHISFDGGGVNNDILSLFCSVSGFAIDVVEHLGSVVADTASIQSPEMPLIQEWISLVEDFTDLSGPYKTMEEHYDAFWKTLTADKYYTTRASKNQALQRPYLAHWFLEKEVADLQQIKSLENQDFLLNFERAALGRRFFVSKKGYLGLAPGKTRPGDLICILFGGQSPFILRKDQEQMIHQERLLEIFGGDSMHHLIGESYVHGLMDGEGYAEFLICNEEGRHTFVLW